MTLSELKYVVAVAHEKHFGRAAKQCHVSQPSLSIAINKLEKRLKVQIFERGKNEIRITELGKQIIEQAQKVLEEAEKIELIAEQNQCQINSPLKLSAIYTVGPYVFPKLIPSIQKLAPEMPLMIQENFTAVLREKLKNGETDVAILACPFSESGILTQAIYEEPFVILMPKDHPLAKETSIKSKDLQAEKILLLGEGHCFRDQILEACPFCQGSPDLQQVVDGTSLETIRHMVASGMGMTVLPASAAQSESYSDSLITRPFADIKPSRKIALAWRASFPRPKAITLLQNALKKAELTGVCLL